MDDQLPSAEELNAISGDDAIAENRAPYDTDPSVPGFKRLRVYQASVDLAEDVYKLTAAFPKEELFGMTRQVRERRQFLRL